jgi:hypothetical protein
VQGIIVILTIQVQTRMEVGEAEGLRWDIPDWWRD